MSGTVTIDADTLRRWHDAVSAAAGKFTVTGPHSSYTHVQKPDLGMVADEIEQAYLRALWKEAQ